MQRRPRWAARETSAAWRPPPAAWEPVSRAVFPPRARGLVMLFSAKQFWKRAARRRAAGEGAKRTPSAVAEGALGVRLGGAVSNPKGASSHSPGRGPYLCPQLGAGVSRRSPGPRSPRTGASPGRPKEALGSCGIRSRAASGAILPSVPCPVPWRESPLAGLCTGRRPFPGFPSVTPGLRSRRPWRGSEPPQSRGRDAAVGLWPGSCMECGGLTPLSLLAERASRGYALRCEMGPLQGWGDRMASSQRGMGAPRPSLRSAWGRHGRRSRGTTSQQGLARAEGPPRREACAMWARWGWRGAGGLARQRGILAQRPPRT